MNELAPAIESALGQVLAEFQGRAAGAWLVTSEMLQQFAFVAAPDLPRPVAQSFAEATRSVPRAKVDLGIVRAAVTGTITISRVSELPPESGSGHWLRQFGAERSIAVPVGRSETGPPLLVISIALGPEPPAADPVAARLRDLAAPWVAVVPLPRSR